MVTPLRRSTAQHLQPTSDESSHPATSTQPRGASEPDVIIDQRPGIPAYLRRENHIVHPPLSCIEASSVPPADLDAARREVALEVAAIDGGELHAVDTQVQAHIRETSTNRCSADATVTLSMPHGGRRVVRAADLPSIARAISEQRGWSASLDAIRSASTAQLPILAAALQRAAQTRMSSGTSVEINLPRCGRVSVSASDLAMLQRLCDATAQLQRARSDLEEIEANNVRGEFWRAGVTSIPVVGSVLAVGECVAGTTTTGRPMSGTECALALVGAALEWTGPAYRFASNVMRTETLALATLNAGVRLRDVMRAVLRLSAAERETIRELVRAMQGRAGAMVELSARQEQTAQTILQRAGLRPGRVVTAESGQAVLQGTAPPHGALSALEVGRQVREAERAGQELREVFHGNAAPEVHPTTWSTRMTEEVVPQGQSAASHTTSESAQRITREREALAGDGATTSSGGVEVSVRGTFSDRMKALFHERVHQLLTARVEGGFLRRLGASGWNALMQASREGQTLRAQLFNYVHEATAEAIAQLRIGNADWLREGLHFPLNNQYGIKIEIFRPVARALEQAPAAATQLLGHGTILGVPVVITLQQQDALENPPMPEGSPYSSEQRAAERVRTAERTQRASINTRTPEQAR